MEMNVCDIMTKDVETVSAEDSLFDAAQKMKDADAGALPVAAEDGTVVGMLTDRDIVLRAVSEGADAKAMRVGQAMTADVVTCRPDCPLDAAANTMRDRQIRRLVITQEHNRNVVGIVSLGDIAVRAHQSKLVGAATEGVCQPCG
jgi:CBS domain-containing protein